MKRLVFDARMIGHPGIGRYQRCLLDALGKLSLPHKMTLVGDPAVLERYSKDFGWEIRSCDFAVYGWKERLLLDRYFRDADLAHFPHFNAPGRLPRRFVWTLHDLIYLNFKEYHPFPGAGWLVASQMRHLAGRCAGLIAVSEATRMAFEKKFHNHGAEIRVIHEAADESPAPGALPPGIAPGYILFVGSIRAHKGVQVLVAAYESLVRRDLDPPGLVLAGGLDPRFAGRYQLVSWLARLPGARWVGRVSDAELSALYRNAALLVMPSFEEGFGLPVLEAMRAGTPVIISDAEALTEVAAEAALVFPAGQIDSLSALLYNGIRDADLRARLAAAGLERQALFSWKKAAQETAEFYDRII